MNSMGSISGLFGALLLGAPAAFSASADRCDQVSKRLGDRITEEPAKVLMLVDEALAKDASCSCDIIKTAIEATDAEPELVREIVVTAVTAAPDEAATIAECAVAEAPEAAAQIKAALTEAFAGAKGGGKSVVYDEGYSEKGSKNVYLDEEDVDEDFGPDPIVVSGVYLIAPSASGSGGFARGVDRVDADEIARRDQLISILRRRAARDRDQGGTTTASGPDPTEPDFEFQSGSTGFVSGTDDFNFLSIDGSTIVNDNSWSGGGSSSSSSVSLSGETNGNNNGEWVSFNHIISEGGGGDASILYWDLDEGSSSTLGTGGDVSSGFNFSDVTILAE